MDAKPFAVDNVTIPVVAPALIFRQVAVALVVHSLALLTAIILVILHVVKAVWPIAYILLEINILI